MNGNGVEQYPLVVFLIFVANFGGKPAVQNREALDPRSHRVHGVILTKKSIVKDNS